MGPSPSRRRFVIGSALVLSAGAVAGYRWLTSAPAQGGDVALNTLSSPYAIKGHDPVIYLRDGAVAPGDAAYERVHAGARYRFASADTLARFDADPERYVPAFGGYCCYGVRMGMKYDIDPTAFEVVDGRLYLQLDPGTRHVWLEDKRENILIAEQVWRDIKDVPPDQLPLDA
jgi:YHS domain-containing protein